jgi:hypothetical protein
MAGPRHGINGVNYAKALVRKVRAVNEAVFARFATNPVIVPEVKQECSKQHAALLARVLRKHRSLCFPR